MTIRADPLPQVLADIARIAGEEAARRVAGAVGGTRVYIPPHPGPDHWLSQLVGQEAARRIGEHFTAGLAGARVDIPLGETGFIASQQARIDAMIMAGRSDRDIALACRYTERGVRKRRARLKAMRDSRQGRLF
ncbi:hypothetical protein [Erythrobacter tepidarius]|uniref:hypothetical protein n=1 Tax=Erythrobacter tepidarius TaxID=60454 RepID=UPI000A366EBE|nr:hypothetical protein [Erythrobacter tepidarius]